MIRFTSRAWIYLALLVLVVLMPQEAQSQDFHVRGSTLQMAQPGQIYLPLPDIRISAWRQGPVRDSLSDGNGRIDFLIAAGSPVKILFEGPDEFLPQLQSLAAAPGMKHTVHVTLFTIEQAKELGINPYLHVKSIIDHLKAQGIEVTEQNFPRLFQLLQRLG